MEKEYIENNIKKICDSASIVKRCMDDNKFLCDNLNDLENEYLKSIYRSDKSGPVLDIRKEVAKTILLEGIDEIKLLEIIESNKLKNPGKIIINNPYRILNPLINQTHSESVDFLKKFGDFLKDRIGDCKIHTWTFDGARFQGQEWCSLLFYNKELKSQSDGMQLWISFKPDLVEYGITDYPAEKSWNNNIVISPDDFNLDDFYKFIDDNKNVILDEKISTILTDTEKEHTFISASIQVLKNFENVPMSAKEIWDHIEKSGSYKASGKTPAASLYAIMSGSSINSNNTNKSKKVIFESVGSNPIKFKLINYTPKRIRESLIDDGFITKEMLIEILSKNNINIEI